MVRICPPATPTLCWSLRAARSGRKAPRVLEWKTAIPGGRSASYAGCAVRARLQGRPRCCCFEVKLLSLWLVFKTLKVFTRVKTISSKYMFHGQRRHAHQPGFAFGTRYFGFGSERGKLAFHIGIGVFQICVKGQHSLCEERTR